MVFVNGCVFLALSLSGVRERIIGAIPCSLKLAITCGIGLFIAFVGLRNGGIVVDSEATFVTHGDFTSGGTALCLAGLALTIVVVRAGCLPRSVRAWRSPPPSARRPER